jgi:outer membrane protein, heavy metal efflux system
MSFLTHVLHRLRSRAFLWSCLGGCLLAMASTVSTAQTLSFNDALARALQESPALKADQARIESARQLLTPAGELPDPALMFGIDNLPVQGGDSFQLGSDFMTMRQIAISQAFPNRAKRDADVAMADRQLQVTRASKQETALRVLQQAASGWVQRYSIERQIQTLDAMLDENARLQQALAASLSSGGSRTVDSIVARQESAELANQRDQLQQLLEQAIAQLRPLLGSAAEASLSGEPPTWPVDAVHLLSESHLHAQLAALEPQLHLLDAEIGRVQADKKPDWALSVGYAQRGRQFSNMLMLQVSVDLPVFADRRQNPRISAKHAERNALEADIENLRRQHIAMIESDLARYTQLQRRISRQRDELLPLAHQKRDLLTAAWRANEGSLSELINARQQVLDAELTLIALEQEHALLNVALHLTYNSQNIQQQLALRVQQQDSHHE